MRRLMWVSIGFAAACALCVYALPNNWIIPLLIILSFSAPLLGWKELRKAAFLCFGGAVGLLWFLVFQRYYLVPALALDGTAVETTVTATDYSYETTYGTAVDGTFDQDGKNYQIRVYINEKTEIEPGDAITGKFQMRYTAPGGVEDATYHSGQGILLLGYQRGLVQLVRAAEGEVSYYAANLAWEIKEILRSVFPEDVFPFTQALLLGDSTELNYETDTAFKISGIRHIIAVSGLHVAILYSLISTVTFRRRYLTALAGIPVLWVFAAAAGFTPSVTRACIMVGLMMLSQVFNREYDSPTALAFAALVMLVRNPLVITSVSFQMSVGCVAGILLFNEPISTWLKSILGNPKGKTLKARLKRWFVSSISVTLSAMSLTTPLSAYYFGTVSLIGVVTNLLTLWVVNFVFNGLVAVCLTALLSVKTASILGWILAWPIRLVLFTAKFLAGFPMSAVYTQSDYIVWWLVFVYVLLGVFLLSHKKRPVILTSCAVLGLCAALLASWLEPMTDDMRLTALDVGQGQSLILQHEGKTFLIDCGGDNDKTTADTVAEALLSQGISRLDGIILTHADRDHAGAVKYLLSRVQTDVLFLSVTTDAATSAELASAVGGEVVWVEENMLLTLGEAELTIFGPTFAAESNENSLCVLFESENCDILVTGDRGSMGEMLLMRETELPQVDLLIVGHHGSKYSTSEEFLAQVQPEVAIISVGEDNPYGHPAQEVLERLEESGCRIYRTDENGTIIFRR